MFAGNLPGAYIEASQCSLLFCCSAFASQVQHTTHELYGSMFASDVNKVNAELRSLKPASKGALDPVSKLWPGHYGAEVQQKHDAGFSCLADDMPTSGGSSAGR